MSGSMSVFSLRQAFQLRHPLHELRDVGFIRHVSVSLARGAISAFCASALIIAEINMLIFPMSALGQKQTYAVHNAMSALPSKASVGNVKSR